jgi:hypothetical protein
MTMAFLRRKDRRHLIPLHRDNARSDDWLIVLEANTIVGPAQGALRVACATRERNIVTRLRSFKPQLFLRVEGYDPRIHVLLFCPQLYHYDKAGKLVPMRGDEIGTFLARALDDKTAVRRPWYGPRESLPGGPVVAETMLDDYDTLLVESPPTQPLLSAPVAEAPNAGTITEQAA